MGASRRFWVEVSMVSAFLVLVAGCGSEKREAGFVVTHEVEAGPRAPAKVERAFEFPPGFLITALCPALSGSEPTSEIKADQRRDLPLARRQFRVLVRLLEDSPDIVVRTTAPLSDEPGSAADLLTARTLGRRSLDDIQDVLKLKFSPAGERCGRRYAARLSRALARH